MASVSVGSVVGVLASVGDGGGSVGGSVGVIGVFVRVKVGGGTGVLVRVAVGTGVRVRVAVGGLGVDVRLGTNVAVKGTRVLLGRVGVMVTKRRGVSVVVGVMDGGESVLVGTSVSVGTKTVTTCSVSAAAVWKLATARSTMLRGSRVMGT